MRFTLLLLITLSSTFLNAQLCTDSINQNYTGICETYYSDGSLKSRTSYVNGIKNGEYTEYYQFGDIGARANFINGKLNGKVYRYYPDSTLQLRMDLDNEETGIYEHFWLDGTKNESGKFKNGFMDGTWTTKNWKGEEMKDFNSLDLIKIYNDGIDSVLKFSAQWIFIEEFGFNHLEDKNQIIEFPDIEAGFVGGPQKLHQFISENVIYPEEAILTNDQGKVYISFVIEKNGDVTNVKVERGVSVELDAEAKRLIESMPDWTPAINRGQYVRARCRIPIAFVLTGSTKKKKKK